VGVQDDLAALAGESDLYGLLLAVEDELGTEGVVFPLALRRVLLRAVALGGLVAVARVGVTPALVATQEKNRAQREAPTRRLPCPSIHGQRNVPRSARPDKSHGSLRCLLLVREPATGAFGGLVDGEVALDPQLF